MATYMKFGPLYTSQHVTDWYQNSPNTSNITTGCPNGVQWIHNIFGDCVIAPREIASFWLGFASLLTWMGVGIPQIIKNFRHIDGMAGVSFFLLFQWTGGDTTNLIGSILTKQLMFQIFLAVWFVLTDAVLLIQYSMFFFRKLAKQKAVRESQAARIGQPPQLILCFMGLFVMSHTLFALTWSSIDATSDYSPDSRHLSRSILSAEDNILVFSPESGPREMNHVAIGNGDILDVNSHTVKSSGSFWHNTTDISGYVIGVISAIFYLGSRMAQIYTNIQNQSTDGLAIMMFIMAVFGNITYGGQILARSFETEFLLEKAPWIVGSLGVIGLDVTLLCQFRHYRHNSKDGVREPLLPKDVPPTSYINGDDTHIINASDSRWNGNIA